MVICLVVASATYGKSYNFLKLKNGNTAIYHWGEYHEKFDAYLGVNAYFNKPEGQGGKYQCTELVHRFIRKIYGFPSKIGMGLGHGKDLARNIGYHFKNFKGKFVLKPQKKISLVYFKNYKTSHIPINGAVISLAYKQYGHVGIVKKTKYINSKKVKIYLFEQLGITSRKKGDKFTSRFVVLNKNSKGKWGAKNTIGWLNPVISP